MTGKRQKPKNRAESAEKDHEAGPEAAGETQPGKDPLEALRAERDDLLARLRRVSADYLNYQKRVQRDIDRAREFANEQIVTSLLTVLDDMERAMEAARANHSDDDPLLAGMQLVHDKALETLGKFGLSAIEAVGKPFDPDMHSAVMQEPSDERPPQTVLREIRKGYRLNERTIRPSTVVVSKSPEEAPGRTEPDDGRNESA